MGPRIVPYAALLALAWLAPPAQAFFDAGLQQTLGSQHYHGTNGYADIGGDWHIKPAFNVYDSDVSSGTYKTFSARLGYDEKIWGAGLTGGFTPKVSGYSNTFVGGDVAFSITPTRAGPVGRIGGTQSAPRGKGVARLDFGGSITHTTHSDEFQTFGRRRTKAIDIGQTDLSVFGGASVLDLLASARLTHSSYDKDLAAVSARAAQVVALAGINSIIQGFPDTSLNLRLEAAMFPILSPFASYTHTTFQLGTPSSDSYTIGVYAGLQIVELNISYELYRQSGSPDLHYASLGAGVRL